MRLRFVVVVALGLALVVYLLRSAGLSAVFTAATHIGWSGFAVLCLYAWGVFVMLGIAWWVLLPPTRRSHLRVLIWARMVRDGAAEVLPFSQLGGMALGVRAAILHGIAAPLAIASMIVDVTTEMMAQIAYVALGVLILSLRAAHTPLARSLTTIFAVGLLLAAAAGAAFLAMQRYGHHWAARKLAGRMFPASMAASAAVATSLDEIYRSGVRIGASITLHLAGWVMGAAGTWIAFRLIGVQVDFAAVIALESLVYATRTAAVVVPNALGVQEAAYALLSPLLGVGKEFGLAVSLIKRARDIGLGIPTLLIWQAVEGQRALSSKPTGKP